MPTTFKVTAFNITRCGYYQRGLTTPEFGFLTDILADLVTWTRGKSLSETLTFRPEGDDTLPAYCFDIRAANRAGDYLLTTWNQIPMVEGGVQTANGTAVVGRVNVELAEVADGNIPGYPSYFYFMGPENLVFSLRPDWLMHNGHQSLVKFLRGFVERASSFVVTNPDPDDADNEIIGYRSGGSEDAPRHLFPGYASSPRRLPGEVEFLREYRHRIRKIVRRDELNFTVQADRNLIGKLLENVGLMNRQVTTESMSFKYEMDFAPSEDDFEQIIRSYYDEADDKTEVGFKLSGEGAPAAAEAPVWIIRALG